MRIYVCLFAIFCATAVPAEAFLNEKLALLRNLKDGLGSSLGSIGGNAAGYGTGYNSGYTYSAPSRPLYTGSENYGYNYGRAASYNTGNVGTEEVIKVVKVVVPAQTSSYSNAGYASSWTPVPQPLPQPQPDQFYAPQPVQVQYEQPAPVQVRVAQPAPARVYAPQPVQVRVAQQVPARVYAPQPVQVQYEQPAPAQVQVAQPAPVQVTVPQPGPQPAPQPVLVRNNVIEQPQTVVKTVRLIVSEVDDNANRGYNQYYPSVSSSYDNSGSWNQGWNNVPGNLLNKSWKSGGVWEKLGC